MLTMDFVVAGSTLRMQIAIDKTALRDHRDKDNPTDSIEQRPQILNICLHRNFFENHIK